jgi:uncharacterized protein YyaL (SSP411 family)
LVRWKAIHDSAVPSGNAVAALDLARLARIFTDKLCESKARRLFEVFSPAILRSPGAHLQALCSLSFALGPSREIIIAEGEDEGVCEMLRLLYQKFIPNKIVAVLPKDPERLKILIGLIPFLDAYRAKDRKTTAYVCRKYQCLPSTSNLERFEELLES